MKKLTLLFVLISGFCLSQTFTLTTEGFKDSNGKEFTVYEFTGKSQSDLFKLAKLYITSNYKNLKGEGYNEVQPDQIVLTLEQNAGVVKKLGIPVIGGDFTNRYEINFKDGKIMVKPEFSYIELPNGMGGLAEKPAFNKNGEVNINKIHFEGINTKTNEFISDLIKGINEGNDW